MDNIHRQRNSSSFMLSLYLSIRGKSKTPHINTHQVHKYTQEGEGKGGKKK